jgi:hypothetical protein
MMITITRICNFVCVRTGRRAEGSLRQGSSASQVAGSVNVACVGPKEGLVTNAYSLVQSDLLNNAKTSLAALAV